MKPFAPLSLWLALIIVTLAFTQEKNEQRTRPDRFQQAFSLPGVEFSADQQKAINELREKYLPKLTDLQQRRGEIETREQRQARREAFRAARQAGKEGRELRQAVEAAVELTAEQRETLAELRREQQMLVAEIQRELRSVLTDQQRESLARREPARRGPRRPGARPTHADVKYGPHGRNVMDVWLAESEKPAPVLVSIHGGGFRGGNKSVAGELLGACLESGISVVAITYRLSGEAIAPAQFLDSARAIQYIRHNAENWNLDPTRIAATGGSAGAGLSLWLGFHDDLADADSDDPLLRQSSRLTCMSVYNGQTSYDPRFIRDLFPGTNTYKHPALAQLYDVDLDKLDELPEEKYRLFEMTAPIKHLTKGDAPALLAYASEIDTPIRSQGIGIHHPRFAQVLKKKMDPLGLECQIHTGVGRDEWASLTIDFVKKHFGLAK